ncbi:MAG TPA: aldehyde dehydrogenase family protein [Steroidobacteraceae bacterium]|jgi:aldehyde dehydrogenase (NAD+)|nr:aldehyde dehydrogenase family protein [Steroidobacteraceae bacterium]
MAHDYRRFYIDGRWVEPLEPQEFTVINPATEAPAGVISLGSAKDVDRAVTAARRAFGSYAETSREERRALLEQILAIYKKRYADIASAIREEMGAPVSLAKGAQAGIGVGHLAAMIELLKTFEFEERRGSNRLRLEPVGVCALITPWNWPMNQVAAKVVPALAAGCTMVLKPSEFAPLSAAIWAEVMHEAGVPAGVFNLINGTGLEVGAALAAHPDIDMVSFTGSTRAGTEVARAAAATVKRVHQELGGKSPNILLDDADFERAVNASVQHVFENAGQSCNAPTRLLVPTERLAEVEALARKTAEAVVVGDPAAEATAVGPVVSKIQFERVQGYIAQGIAEGAKLVAGGEGRPAGLAKGYFVRPTIFSGVNNQMTIAREEIFGPVLAILPYRDEEEAIRIANDTPYGLQAYIWSGDLARANRVGRKIRAGRVTINGTPGDMSIPFGGFKRSGNGREWGEYGLRDFLEVKALLGAEAQA